MSSDTFTPLALPRLGQDHAAEESRRRGHAAGYAEGMRQAHLDAARTAAETAAQQQVAAARAAAAVDAAVAALTHAAAAFTAQADTLARLDEQQVMTLAVDLAETILSRDLADPVRAALTAADRASAVADVSDAPVLVLHPGDLAILDQQGVTLPAAAETSVDLTPGDALVRVRDGLVDLRVSAALERARTALEATE